MKFKIYAQFISSRFDFFFSVESLRLSFFLSRIRTLQFEIFLFFQQSRTSALFRQLLKLIYFSDMLNFSFYSCSEEDPNILFRYFFSFPLIQRPVANERTGKDEPVVAGPVRMFDQAYHCFFL